MDLEGFQRCCADVVGSVPLGERPVLLTRMVRHLAALESQVLDEWRSSVPGPRRTAAEAGLGVQMGLATAEVTRLVGRAVERVALLGGLRALADGRIGAAHLDAAVAGVRGAPPSVVADVDELLAASAPERTPREVARTVREVVGLRDHTAAARRAQAVIDERSVSYLERRDGRSRLVVEGPAMQNKQVHDSLRSLGMTGWPGRPGHDARDDGEVGVPARMFDALYERVTGLTSTLPTTKTTPPAPSSPLAARSVPVTPARAAHVPPGVPACRPGVQTDPAADPGGATVSMSSDPEVPKPEPDAGSTTAGEPEAGWTTAGEPEAGSTTAGEPEAGSTTAGEPDAGSTTAGEPDGELFEVGSGTPPGTPSGTASRCPARAVPVIVTASPGTIHDEVHLAGDGRIPTMTFPHGTTVDLAVTPAAAEQLTTDPLVLAGLRPLSTDVGTQTWVVVIDDATLRVVRQPAHDHLDRWRTVYTPTRAIRRYVRRRDQHCRYPGCLVPAAQCHIDHLVAWNDGGRSTRANLACLCAQHHLRVKHSGLWTVTGTADTTLHWTSSGRTTTTDPPALPVPRRTDEHAMAGP